MTDWLTDEWLQNGRRHGGVYIQDMIKLKADHPADECGGHGCSQADQATWPEPELHRRLPKVDEFRTERIRMACADGRPEVLGA